MFATQNRKINLRWQNREINLRVYPKESRQNQPEYETEIEGDVRDPSSKQHMKVDANKNGVLG